MHFWDLHGIFLEHVTCNSAAHAHIDWSNHCVDLLLGGRYSHGDFSGEGRGGGAFLMSDS